MKPDIVVTQPVHADVVERLAALGTVDINPGPEPLCSEDLARRLAGAQALVGFMTDRVDAGLLRTTPALRIRIWFSTPLLRWAGRRHPGSASTSASA